MFNKPMTIFLLILVVILTVAASYLYTKKSPSEPAPVKVEALLNENSNQTNTNAQTNLNINQNLNTNQANTNINSTDGEASPPVNKSRASNPENAYLVKAGETLYPIGLKFNLDWTLIAKANGLTDSNSLKAGTILVIPTYDKDTKKMTINYQTDQSKADTLQKNITQGKELWRQDPVEVSKRESFPCFGLAQTDSYTLGSRNDEKGLAQVSAVKNNVNYEVGLVQPSTKGADGIWTISYVKEI